MVVICAYYHVRRYSFQGRTEGVRSHGGAHVRESSFRAIQMGVLHMVALSFYHHVMPYAFQGHTAGVRAHGGNIFDYHVRGCAIYSTHRG